jgi:hypothetical protein
MAARDTKVALEVLVQPTTQKVRVTKVALEVLYLLTPSPSVVVNNPMQF